MKAEPAKKRPSCFTARGEKGSRGSGFCEGGAELGAGAELVWDIVSCACACMLCESRIKGLLGDGCVGWLSLRRYEILRLGEGRSSRMEMED